MTAENYATIQKALEKKQKISDLIIAHPLHQEVYYTLTNLVHYALAQRKNGVSQIFLDSNKDTPTVLAYYQNLKDQRNLEEEIRKLSRQGNDDEIAKVSKDVDTLREQFKKIYTSLKSEQCQHMIKFIVQIKYALNEGASIDSVLKMYEQTMLKKLTAMPNEAIAGAAKNCKDFYAAMQIIVNKEFRGSDKKESQPHFNSFIALLTARLKTRAYDNEKHRLPSFSPTLKTIPEKKTNRNSSHKK
jgi:hypothetical protein